MKIYFICFLIGVIVTLAVMQAIPKKPLPDPIETIRTETIIDTVNHYIRKPAEILHDEVIIRDTIIIRVAELADSVAYDSTCFRDERVTTRIRTWYHFRDNQFAYDITNEIKSLIIYRDRTEFKYPPTQYLQLSTGLGLYNNLADLWIVKFNPIGLTLLDKVLISPGILLEVKKDPAAYLGCDLMVRF